MSSFNLSILTPGGTIFDDSAESLVAPGAAGSFGVLANHASMIAATLPGVLTVKTPKEIYFAVGSGVLEVCSGDVNFLADAAETADSIEDARGKAAELTVPR